MTTKIDVNLELAHRLLHPKLTVLVSCSDASGRANIITLAWSMPVSMNPPLIAVSIAPRRYSHRLIEETGEFIVNVPSIEILKETSYCGSISGRDVDKFKMTGLTPAPARKVRAPIIEECIAHLECKVYKKVQAGDHTIFIGEIVAAYANEGVFKRVFDIGKVRLIYHLGGDKFTTTSSETYTP